MFKNLNDDRGYLKSREVPEGLDLSKKATLHKGYQGYLDMLKDDSDEEGTRSMAQELDYSDRRKSSK